MKFKLTVICVDCGTKVVFTEKTIPKGKDNPICPACGSVMIPE